MCKYESIRAVSDVTKDYWAGPHPHPLAPNADDVADYRRLIGDSVSVLLLGNTPALMELCDVAMDMEPFADSPKVVRQDWTTNQDWYDAIIGDGVLNFTDVLAREVLDMAARSCRVFVARAFSRRLPIMRVADNFPTAEEFTPRPVEVLERVDYRFFVWRFPG